MKDKVKKIVRVERKNKGLKFFLQETKLELKRVSWPTKAKVASTSLVILAIVVILTAFVAVADMGLAKLFELLRAIK